MICIYPADCTDFSSNGLGIVQPQSCTVTETLNGEWELTLVHPIDEHGRWTRLSEGNILRAPVPAAMTPQMNLVTQQYQTQTYDVEIYKVTTQRDPLRLRSGTGTRYRILGKYKKGTEVIVVNKTTSSWYEVTCPDGRHGYMSSEYLTHVRTEQQSVQVDVGFQNQVIESRQLRDQPFRIYRVAPELDKVTVYARHIFYDLLDNMIKSLKPSSSAVGASVVQSLSDACLTSHDFTFYSDLTSTAEEVEWENVNPVEALLGEGGLVEKYGAELARDWFDVFLVRRVGVDSDVQIRERKNLTGISYDVDETDVVTRIMPTGEDADGNILYLPELYIDSPNIGAYTHPKWIHLAASEAKEVAEGENYKSLTACYEDMRAAAQAEFDKGCDLPTVTLKVDFVNCADTEEYRQYAFLLNIFLGDSVRVVARRIGVEVSMRMTQYTYDCLTRKYTSVTLGTAADTLEGSMISARQLASGSITGMKLALNSVGSGQLQSGSVGSLQIRNAAIGSAHIQDACITRAHIAEALIDTLNVNALTAVTAKIKELAAGSITTDDLYASVAMIATAQLTTANIVSADIQWADIEALSANIAQISKAQITAATIDEANIDWAAITTLTAATAEIVNAQMQTADIDWSHIKDLATDTAIITQGTAGELYIARLAVTEANMVSLTVGELVVKGTDGHFYSVSVNEDGQVVTTLKQIVNDDVTDQSINGGEKIIEGTITAGTLNAQDIFADNAVIRSLIAANLDVDALFAREATIAALNAMDITGNEYLRLMVSGKADQEDLDALGERVDAAELKLTEDAIVSTVTGSDQYREDLAAIAAAGGAEFVVGTQTTYTAAWTGNASFQELRDGQQIAYWLPAASGSNVTLALTLADGSTTEAIPCYYGGSVRLGTQYGAGNIVRLTYRENVTIYSTTIAKGWWADANYNTDTYDRIRVGTTLKAKTAIAAGRLAVTDADGCFPLAAGVPFDVTRPVLYCATAVSAGMYSANFYLTYPFCTLRSIDPDFAGTIGTTCYVVGTLAGTVFTPAETCITATVPTEDDGMTYMALGTLTGTYQTCVFPEHPLYRFVDGAFKPLSQVGYDASVAVGETRQEMSTRFEQTDAAIALKADQTEVDSLSTRVQSAEQKITPQAITATVASSALYAFDKYEGRNYCLDSGNEYTFVGNRYQNPDGSMTVYTQKTLAVSDDLFAHSGNGAAIRISLDIKRTDIDASASSTENVYGGFWVYYRYYGGDDGTTLYTTGRGWYLRVTDTNFQTTDDDWVRLRYGPLNLTSYSPVAIAYFALGTSSANGVTGTLRYRNVKLEVLDVWTDWSAAPEDIYGLAGRMTSAESRITQNANSIALKISTSLYNTEKVYRSNTAPTTLYTNMLWLDTSLSPPILKRYTGSAWVAVGAQELKTSGISIGSNNVAITTENFLLQLLDPANNENVLMEMSADGNVGFKELYADEIISDSVAQAYAGPSALYVNASYSGTSDTYFRSLGEAVKGINNRFLRRDVVIYLPSSSGDIYEPQGTQIEGISGPGRLMIYGYSACRLNSYIRVKGCSAHVCFQNVSLRESRPLNGSSRNPYLVECLLCHFVELNGCTLDANNVTYDSVYARASHVFLYNTGLYNALQGVEAYLATANVKDCKGSCSWAMISYASVIIASGTVPNGSRGTGENGQLFASGVTVDYGTAIPVVVPDSTTIQYATLTKSYRGGWRSDTVDVIQGVYSDSGYKSSLNWNYGCMWFGNLRSVLSGTTIKSATLTLYRKTGSGSSSAKTLYLCAITNTTASGAPSIAVNYGAIGTIGRAQQATFAIPLAAVQGLANGTYGGLCLYESKYNFGSSNWSNNYMRMAGTDSSHKPYLQVVYNSGGSAVG